MRQSIISAAVASLLGLLLVVPALAVKIEHDSTLYADNDEGALSHPEGVACSSDSLLVADTGNSRIVRYTLSPNGLTPDAVFPLPETSPILLQTNSGGDIYALDGKTRTILKLNRDGKAAGKVEPRNLPDPQNHVIRSFRLDDKGNIFLLDIRSERVLVLNASEEYLRHLPLPEGFDFFSDIEIDSRGRIFLLDGVAGSIYVAKPEGDSFEILSRDLKENMNFPVSMAIDSRGTLYLSDQYGSGLALVGPDGSFKGRKFSMGWSNGQFYYPAQICINEQDILAVADRNNNRVQVFNILAE